MKLLQIGFTLLWLGVVSISSYAQPLIVGVAGGFKPAMEPLIKLFAQQTGQEVLASYASVGALYAQIRQGGPFDLFISADSLVPERLEQQGLGVPGTRISYAVSQLVLWSASRERIDGTSEILQRNTFKHLALPNPKVGVHGKAAIEVLDKLGLTRQISGKFVEGKNVLQTFQYIETEAAELGFISMSLIHRGSQPLPGSYWIVPDSLHTPLVQQAIRLSKANSPDLAQAFLDFMLTPQAQSIIKYYGYRSATSI
ncbi:MAG: molybdate ABC transporter substrate-binding protein [Psychromonas sp.]|nr:molybdate ABC transporter substrate-binding protein [Psychromonas sp.]